MDKDTTLDVRISAAAKASARARAEAQGYTLSKAVRRLLGLWVDGTIDLAVLDRLQALPSLEELQALGQTLEALDESTNPEWNHVVTLELFPFSQLTVKVFDWDASGPQLIAGKSYRIDKELKGLFSGKPLQHRTSLKSVPKLRMSFVPVK